MWFLVIMSRILEGMGFGVSRFLARKLTFFFLVFLQGDRAAGQQGACIDHQGLRKIRVPGQQERTIHILLSRSIFGP